MASPGLCSTLTLWWKLSLSYIIITINEVRIASHPAFLEDFPAQLSLGEAAHVQRPPHRPGPEVGVSHESNLWSTLQGGGEAGQLRIAGQLNGSIWYLAIKHGTTWWALKTAMEESWDDQQCEKNMESQDGGYSAHSGLGNTMGNQWMVMGTSANRDFCSQPYLTGALGRRCPSLLTRIHGKCRTVGFDDCVDKLTSRSGGHNDTTL